MRLRSEQFRKQQRIKPDHMLCGIAEHAGRVNADRRTHGVADQYGIGQTSSRDDIGDIGAEAVDFIWTGSICRRAVSGEVDSQDTRVYSETLGQRAALAAVSADTVNQDVPRGA